MNNVDNFDLKEILKLDQSSNSYLELLENAQHYQNKKLKIYYPGNNFPSISVTGTQCDINCKYCNKMFLSHMLSAETPEDLYNICHNLKAKKAKGALISGGYNKRGVVPLKSFISTIEMIKNETDLTLNLHTGLVTKEEAELIASTGTTNTIISFDLVQDNTVINDIIGLPNTITANSYEKSFHYLIDAGLEVIPHISIGMNYGKYSIKAIEKAISLSVEARSKIIVFLGLIPKKGTEMANIKPPNPLEFQKILLYSVLRSAGKNEISVGCMRKKSEELDIASINAGINRIQIPRRGAIQYAEKKGIKITKFNHCCAV